MRTRAQESRDAALRRLTRVNHSLAAAALLGAAVVTDVVANTASGHTRAAASRGIAATRPHAVAAAHRAALHRDENSSTSESDGGSEQSAQSVQSSAPPAQSVQSSPAPAVNTASSAPVVAVSGGS